MNLSLTFDIKGVIQYMVFVLMSVCVCVCVWLLCPWDFPGKNIGMGCNFLLQGIFLTQGWNLRLQHWQVDSLPLSHLGKYHAVIRPYIQLNFVADT